MRSCACTPVGMLYSSTSSRLARYGTSSSSPWSATRWLKIVTRRHVSAVGVPCMPAGRASLLLGHSCSNCCSRVPVIGIMMIIWDCRHSTRVLLAHSMVCLMMRACSLLAGSWAILGQHVHWSRVCVSNDAVSEAREPGSSGYAEGFPSCAEFMASVVGEVLSVRV